MFYKKSCSQKCLNTHRKSPALESFFRKLQTFRAATLLKREYTQVFYCCEIFSKHLFWRISAHGCFWTDFTRWWLRALFLDNHFKNHLDSVILQKYHSLWNQSFKYNLAHMSSLYLTLRFLLNVCFVYSSLTVTTHKGSSCSPWAPYFYF